MSTTALRPMNLTDEWTLLDEGGGAAINFSSFLSISVNSDGQVASYPLEKGSFANYNKVQSPRDVRVSIAVQGSESDYEYVLNRLDTYKEQAIKVSVSTPSRLYDNLTLQSYGTERAANNGASMLVVMLNLVEVREVETQTAPSMITGPQNPTSANKVTGGPVQTIPFTGQLRKH